MSDGLDILAPPKELTLRDYFAAACLTTYEEVGHNWWQRVKDWAFGEPLSFEEVAVSCYAQADAMLATRSSDVESPSPRAQAAAPIEVARGR